MANQMAAPSAESQQHPLEQRVFLSLVKAAARLEAGLNRLFRQFELTHATYSILAILKESPQEGASCGQIAARLVAEVPDMTRLLDRLERIGYVRRERSKADRRMVRVFISDKGAEALSTLREPVSDYYRMASAQLNSEKQLALVSLLDELLGDTGAAGVSSGERQEESFEL